MGYYCHMKTTRIKRQVKTDYGVFEVALEREPDMGGYMVTVPKVSDVVTWGKTRQEAERMAKEAIECSLEGEILIAAEKKGAVTIHKYPVLV